MENPKPAPRFVPLITKGVLLTCGGGSCNARFRSLDRRVDPIASARGLVGHEVAGEKGG